MCFVTLSHLSSALCHLRKLRIARREKSRSETHVSTAADEKHHHGVGERVDNLCRSISPVSRSRRTRRQQRPQSSIGLPSLNEASQLRMQAHLKAALPQLSSSGSGKHDRCKRHSIHSLSMSERQLETASAELSTNASAAPLSLSQPAGVAEPTANLSNSGDQIIQRFHFEGFVGLELKSFCLTSDMKVSQIRTIIAERMDLPPGEFALYEVERNNTERVLTQEETPFCTEAPVSGRPRRSSIRLVVCVCTNVCECECECM
jgi:hypothetical protein